MTEIFWGLGFAVNLEYNKILFLCPPLLKLHLDFKLYGPTQYCLKQLSFPNIKHYKEHGRTGTVWDEKTNIQLGKILSFSPSFDTSQTFTIRQIIYPA